MNKQVIYKFIVPILFAFPLTTSAQKVNNDVQSMTFDGKTLTIPLPGAEIKEALKANDLKSLSIDTYIQPVDFKQYMTKPRIFPANPSETMKRAMLRHMATTPDAAVSQIFMIDRAYSNVAKQINKWLKSAGYGAPVTPNGPMIRVASFSGTLDPVELIRNYKREKQQEKTWAIIAELNRLPEKSQTFTLQSGFLKNETELESDKVLQAFVPVQIRDSLNITMRSDTLFLVKKDSLHTDTLKIEQIK